MKMFSKPRGYKNLATSVKDHWGHEKVTNFWADCDDMKPLSRIRRFCWQLSVHTCVCVCVWVCVSECVCLFLCPSFVHVLRGLKVLAGENETRTATGKRAGSSETETAESSESRGVNRHIEMFTLKLISPGDSVVVYIRVSVRSMWNRGQAGAC